jgi:hypothetical protein
MRVRPLLRGGLLVLRLVAVVVVLLSSLLGGTSLDGLILGFLVAGLFSLMLRNVLQLLIVGRLVLVKLSVVVLDEQAVLVATPIQFVRCYRLC